MKALNVTKRKSLNYAGFKNHWGDKCTTFFSCDFSLNWQRPGLPEVTSHLWLFGFQIFELEFYNRG